MVSSFLKTTVAVLLCSFLAANAQYPPRQQPYQTLEGTVCQPPLGYRARICGEETILEQTSVPAPLFKYGPNVCRVGTRVMTNELEYRLVRYCDWVFDRYYYTWIQRCSLICQPTNVCTDRTQEFERFNFECCEGFDTRPATDKSHYTYQRNLHYFRQEQVTPVGCPRAFGDSILECLMRQNLTDFVAFVNQSDFFDLLNTTTKDLPYPVTVFAPTNAAFAAIMDELIGMDPTLLVGNHIVNGTVQEVDLIYDGRFQTMNNLTLHSTSVAFRDFSIVGYHSNVFEQVRFISGARIVNRDACRTDMGVLHIIDTVLMPGPDTIATFLENNPDMFSRFTEATRFAGILRRLNETEGVSRTLFLPTNDAFDEQIPPDLYDCLTTYMRVPLNNLILYHLARSAEYNTSLNIRMATFTLLVGHYNAIESILITNQNGTLCLGNNQLDTPAKIITPNIPASNGVIHVIDRVLIPPNFDFGMCQRFVPTTPPPTPPTTLPTTPPTTAPLPTTIAGPPDEIFGSGMQISPEDDNKVDEKDDDDKFIDYGDNP